MLTGAGGFVGSAVVRELLSRGHRVHALVHSRPLDSADGRVRSFKGEADDPQVLDAALEGATVAIHLVGIIAERPEQGLSFQRAHVGLTGAVVDACVRRGVQRYIHMSALGARADAPSLYHQTKAAAEEIVRASPLSWTIFRPSLIHGPRGEFTRTLVDWSLGRAAPWVAMPYFGAGAAGLGRKALIQPVLVDDVARAFAEALERPEAIGKQYDLVGEQWLTWPQMYRIASLAIRGRPRAALPIPAWFALMLTRLVPRKWVPFNREQVLMSQEDNTGDIGAFERDFGWRPGGFEQTFRADGG